MLERTPAANINPKTDQWCNSPGRHIYRFPIRHVEHHHDGTVTVHYGDHHGQRVTCNPDRPVLIDRTDTETDTP